jgi:DNA-binding transcriptional LysR family regulator
MASRRAQLKTARAGAREWETDGLDSRRLRQFLAVYETGSIAAAAEVVLLTQPALSKALKSLELELGVDLFERTSSGVRPTVFAEALVGHARKVVAELQDARSQIAHLKGETGGEVRLGVGHAVATRIVPAFLQHRAEALAGITIEVTEGSVGHLIPALRRGELDFVLSVYPDSGDAELTSQPLLSDCAMLAAREGHPALAGNLSMAQLLRYRWILPPGHHSWRAGLDSAFTSRGLHPPTPAVISNSPAIIVETLRRTEMLSFLPQRLLGSGRAAPGISTSDTIAADLQVSLIRAARRRPPPAVAHVIAALSDFMQEAEVDSAA